jgi:hypothetical protein
MGMGGMNGMNMSGMASHQMPGMKDMQMKGMTHKSTPGMKDMNMSGMKDGGMSGIRHTHMDEPTGPLKKQLAGITPFPQAGPRTTRLMPPPSQMMSRLTETLEREAPLHIGPEVASVAMKTSSRLNRLPWMGLTPTAHRSNRPANRRTGPQGEGSP